MSKVAEKFHDDLRNATAIMRRNLGIKPIQNERMLNLYGGVEWAHRLLRERGTTDGFTSLWEKRRLDLSVEAFVVLSWYTSLFSEDEREEARRRLTAYGFNVEDFLENKGSRPPSWFTAEGEEDEDEEVQAEVEFEEEAESWALAGEAPSGPPPTPPPNVGLPYERADENVQTAGPDPFPVDPNVIDRGRRGHAVTQNALADSVEAHEWQALKCGSGDPDFDLAWYRGATAYVAEVKSLTDVNETRQLRLGLGQVLEYRYRLEQRGVTTRGVLAVEKQPSDPSWVGICARSEVLLVWPATFSLLGAQDVSA